jgi:hypothetical protein
VTRLRTNIEVFDRKGVPLGTAYAIHSHSAGGGRSGMLQKQDDNSMQDIPPGGSEVEVRLPSTRRGRATILNRAQEPAMTADITGIGPAPFA